MGSVVTGIFLPSWASPDYTPAERVNLWRGLRFSCRFGLWEQMLATDLTTVITRLSIPAYFLHGHHDRTVSYHVAKAYAGQLDAPLIGFYTFENSAQGPAFEEPDRTPQILTENVLTRTTNILLTADTDERGEVLARELHARWVSRDAFFAGAFLRGTGDFVAQVYLGPVDWQVPALEVGYIADCQQEGQGFVTEAVNGILAMAFDHLSGLLRDEHAHDHSVVVRPQHRDS